MMDQQEQTAQGVCRRLADYHALQVPFQTAPVTEAEIDRILDNRAHRLSDWRKDSGPARTNSHIVLDFSGETDGEPIPGSSMEKVRVEMGCGQMLPGVEKQIVGHCAGDQFTMHYTYPADFRVPELRGVEAVFHLTLRQVKNKLPAPINEGFAIQQGFDSLADLRGRIRADKEKEHAALAERNFREECLRRLTAASTVEIPQEAVDRMASLQLRNMQKQMGMLGMEFEDYLAQIHQTQESWLAREKEHSRYVLASTAVLDALARALRLEVSDAEIETEYRTFAARNETTAEAVRQRYPDAVIRASLANRKALDALAAAVQRVPAGAAESEKAAD
jgi:trigger factor